jgi:hypothetical protein
VLVNADLFIIETVWIETRDQAIFTLMQFIATLAALKQDTAQDV